MRLVLSLYTNLTILFKVLNGLFRILGQKKKTEDIKNKLVVSVIEMMLIILFC